MKRYLGFVFLLTVTCMNSFGQKVFKAKRVSINKDYAISSPSNNDKSVVRFEVRPGDYASSGSRSELMYTNLGNTSHFEFSFRAVQLTDEKLWFHISDWHVGTDLFKAVISKGVKLYSPLMLDIENNSIVLNSRAGVYTGDVYNLKRDAKKRMKIYSSPLLSGWNTVSIDIVWSDTDNGQITANVNGNKQVISNIRTTYDMAYPNFFKVGIYRSPQHLTTSILEFKNIIVGDNSIVPNFDRAASGEQNNNPVLIKKYQNYQKSKK